MLRTVMYESPKAYPGPSQATTINLFARIVYVFKLTLLTIFAKSTNKAKSGAFQRFSTPKRPIGIGNVICLALGIDIAKILFLPYESHLRSW